MNNHVRPTLFIGAFKNAEIKVFAIIKRPFDRPFDEQFTGGAMAISRVITSDEKFKCAVADQIDLRRNRDAIAFDERNQRIAGEINLPRELAKKRERNAVIKPRRHQSALGRPLLLDHKQPRQHRVGILDSLAPANLDFTLGLQLAIFAPQRCPMRCGFGGNKILPFGMVTQCHMIGGQR